MKTLKNAFRALSVAKVKAHGPSKIATEDKYSDGEEVSDEKFSLEKVCFFCKLFF